MDSLAQRAVPRRPDWRRYQARLDALRQQHYNLDLARDVSEADGWHLDHHAADLVPEPPGPPLPPDDPHASFAIARDLVRAYAFPDPRLITGIFSPDESMAGRPMLLRARFLGVTFWFGVKVGREIDEVRETDGGRVWAYGFDYATLEGHFERGQITFEVRKAQATGAVTFHIDAFSQPDRIGNPLFRLGFRLFGRRLQLRFARTAIERMQRFVREELAARARGTVAPDPKMGTAELAPDPVVLDTMPDTAPSTLDSL